MFEQLPLGTVVRWDGNTYFFPHDPKNRNRMIAERLDADPAFERERNPPTATTIANTAAQAVPLYGLSVALVLLGIGVSLVTDQVVIPTSFISLAIGLVSILAGAGISIWCARQIVLQVREWRRHRAMRKFERAGDLTGAANFIRVHPA